MIVTNALLAILLIYIVYKIIRYIRLVILVNRLPGYKTIWPIGNSLKLFLTKYEDLEKYVRELGEPFRDKPFFKYWVFYYPTVNITKASSAEVILRSSSEIRKHYIYELALTKWLGQGLITSTGQKWNADRKMLTPCFHFQILNNFISIFNDKSRILIAKLEKHSKKEFFDIYPYLTLLTLDVICEAAMGKNINAQINKDSKYINAISQLSKIIAKKVCNPLFTRAWFYPLTVLRWQEDKCLKILHDFTDKVITERKAERKTQKQLFREENGNDVLGIKKKKIFLDLLLDMAENNQQLTDREIREQVDTFMFAGHDTTSCSINWAIYFLGKYPEIQQKVYEELNQIFGDDKDREVTSSDIANLKYLEAVIKESIRMVPIVPMFGRHLLKDIEIEGYTIPAGVSVMIMSYFVHHDPDIYDQPDVFDPERFLIDNKSGRHPYGFLGFSAGPRNCIGQKFSLMEQKVVLSHVLRNYVITSRDELKDIKIGMSVIAKPLTGTYIQLHPRI